MRGAITTGGTRTAFADAAGFPRLVIDDFLPHHQFAAVADEFCSFAETPATGHTAAYAKAAATDPASLGPATTEVVAELQARAWLDQLCEVTGIPDLLADPDLVPHFAHATPRGGYTRIHRDSLRHPTCELFRRVALILYVHHEWDVAWGGDFEVWDRRLRTRIERVAPLPNRAVLFTTTPRSWHGFPDPLGCPEGRTRNALTLWYWSAEHPGGRAWRRGDAAATFRRRPGSDDPSRWAMRQRSIRDLVPPSVRRLARRVRPHRG